MESKLTNYFLQRPNREFELNSISLDVSTSAQTIELLGLLVWDTRNYTMHAPNAGYPIGICAKTWIRDESPENDPALKRVDTALTSEKAKR
jgi:hypothetical protein